MFLVGLCSALLLLAIGWGTNKLHRGPISRMLWKTGLRLAAGVMGTTLILRTESEHPVALIFSLVAAYFAVLTYDAVYPWRRLRGGRDSP